MRVHNELRIAKSPFENIYGFLIISSVGGKPAMASGAVLSKSEFN